MWKAAKATYPLAWERAMKEIQNINDDAYKHLIKIPPRFWSKSRFSFQSKCDVLVNNMSETFNSVILDAREKPILTMLEDIRTYLMSRWAKNRNKINNFQGSVMPKIKERLEREGDASGGWIATWAGDEKFEVSNGYERFSVDLRVRECSCRKWSLTGIPCVHSLSCIHWWSRKPEDYVPIYYRKEAYQACYRPIICPTNGPNLWQTTEYPDVLPPPYRKPIGRPKKVRRKDPNEETKGSCKMRRTGFAIKCSNCGIVGHNKRGCKDSSQTKTLSHVNQNMESISSSTQPSEQVIGDMQPTEGTSSQPILNATRTFLNMLPTQETLNQPNVQRPWQNVPSWRTPRSHLVVQRRNRTNTMAMTSKIQATTSNQPAELPSNGHSNSKSISQPNATT